MPYKHNESRRHKIKKFPYKVTNWHNYNNGLRQGGNVTIWFTEEAITDWHPAKPRSILTKAMELGSIVIVASVGLKVYGKDEWHQEKHNVSARRI